MVKTGEAEKAAEGGRDGNSSPLDNTIDTIQSAQPGLTSKTKADPVRSRPTAPIFSKYAVPWRGAVIFSTVIDRIMPQTN